MVPTQGAWSSVSTLKFGRRFGFPFLWCLLSFSNVLSLSLFFFLVFLEQQVQHVEVLRLGVESELQLSTYTTATAMWDPSHICDLHHSSQQGRILIPLSEARD